MSNDLTCVFQGIGLVGALYISSYKTANNPKLLQKHNIKAVITAQKDKLLLNENNQISKYLHLQISTKQDSLIQRYFNQAFQFIQQARKSSNILVHCQSGNNQCVFIVIAYLIKRYHYSLHQIYTLIKRKRQHIQINPNLIKILQLFSKKYSIPNHLPNDRNDAQKLKLRRTNSLNNSGQKQSIKDFYQNLRLINSDLLKQNHITNHHHCQQELLEQEKQKISTLLKQRQQIEYKLRYLRYGLIRGKNIKNLVVSGNERIRPEIKNDRLDIEKRQEIMSENKNPNEQQICINDKKISNLAQYKMEIKRDNKPNLEIVQMTQSIDLYE